MFYLLFVFHNYNMANFKYLNMFYTLKQADSSMNIYE